MLSDTLVCVMKKIFSWIHIGGKPRCAAAITTIFAAYRLRQALRDFDTKTLELKQRFVSPIAIHVFLNVGIKLWDCSFSFLFRMRAIFKHMSSKQTRHVEVD